MTNERWERARRIADGRAPNLTLLADAQDAIDYFIDHNHFYPGSKEQFALRMGWTTGQGRGEKPDRRRVERVCNLTRDQEDFPEYESTLCGFVIAYSPSQGGMCLIDPTGDHFSDVEFLHVLVGDAQRQQAAKTVARRRIPMWKTVGDGFAALGELELARLFWQGEREISAEGFVSDSLTNDLFQTLRAHGYVEAQRPHGNT